MCTCSWHWLLPHRREPLSWLYILTGHVKKFPATFRMHNLTEATSHRITSILASTESLLLQKKGSNIVAGSFVVLGMGSITERECPRSPAPAQTPTWVISKYLSMTFKLSCLSIVSGVFSSPNGLTQNLYCLVWLKYAMLRNTDEPHNVQMSQKYYVQMKMRNVR